MHGASSEARLAPTGRLRAFDVDPRAIEVARALEEEDPRLCGSSWSPQTWATWDILKFSISRTEREITLTNNIEV